MCKYCNIDGITIIDTDVIIDTDYDKEYEEGITISMDAGTGDLIIDAAYDGAGINDFMTTHIEYCPMCGRKL